MQLMKRTIAMEMSHLTLMSSCVMIVDDSVSDGSLPAPCYFTSRHFETATVPPRIHVIRTAAGWPTSRHGRARFIELMQPLTHTDTLAALQQHARVHSQSLRRGGTMHRQTRLPTITWLPCAQ